MKVVVFTSCSEFSRTLVWKALVDSLQVSEVWVCRRLEDPCLLGDCDIHALIWPEFRREGLEVRWLDAESADPVQVVRQVSEWAPDIGLRWGGGSWEFDIRELPRMGTVAIEIEALDDRFSVGRPLEHPELPVDGLEARCRWFEHTGGRGTIISEVRAALYPQDTREDVRDRVEELAYESLRGALSHIAKESNGGAGSVAASRQVRERFDAPRANARSWGELLGLGLGKLSTTVKRFLLLQMLILYRPVRDLVRRVGVGHPVRIFTFHRVSSLVRDGMTVRPRVFREQLKYIMMSHEVVDLPTALESLKSGKRLERPLAVVTFDDAYRSVFDLGFPIMRALGVPGTCFVATGYVGAGRSFDHDLEATPFQVTEVMDWPDLMILKAQGWTIGAHTVTHPRLSDVSPRRLRSELSEPLDQIRERVPQELMTVAYPFGGPGDITEAGLEAVAALGYAACFSDFGGENWCGEDPIRLKRIELGGDHDGLAWKARVHGMSLAWLRNVLPFLDRGSR